MPYEISVLKGPESGKNMSSMTLTDHFSLHRGKFLSCVFCIAYNCAYNPNLNRQIRYNYYDHNQALISITLTSCVWSLQ